MQLCRQQKCPERHSKYFHLKKLTWNKKDTSHIERNVCLVLQSKSRLRARIDNCLVKPNQLLFRWLRFHPYRITGLQFRTIQKYRLVKKGSELGENVFHYCLLCKFHTFFFQSKNKFRSRLHIGSISKDERIFSFR